MERTITIKGKADILVSPDYTTVVLFLRETDKSYKKAFESLQQKSIDISECAKSVGISEDDIKTTNYSAQALKKTERDRKGNYIQVDDGYACSQTLSIGFNTDPVLLGDLISAINKKVDNPNMTISFSIKDKKKYEEELLKKVTEDAQSKAKIFCQPSNAKIGKLLSVNYQRGNLFVPFPVRTPVAPPVRAANNDMTVLIGETGKLTQGHPAARMPMAPSMPAPSLPQQPVINNIIPEDRRVEEEAIFVWEIIDDEKGE